MSKECDFCGKKPQVGNLVSHSNIKTKRRFNPNLQRVRHQFPDGSVRTLTVCTRCLRSGAVTKPAARKQGSFFFRLSQQAPSVRCRGFFYQCPHIPPPHSVFMPEAVGPSGAGRAVCRPSGATLPALPAWPTIPSGAIGDLCSAPAAYRMC